MDEASGAVAGDCGRAAVSAASPSDEPPSECGAATAGPDRPLDDVEMRAWRAFLAASTSVSASLNHELEVGAGVSMHAYEILVRLSEAPDRPLRMSTDKRGVDGRRTEEGLSFLRAAATIHLDGVRRHVVDRFTHEQLIALTGLLTVLVGGGTD